MEDEESLAHITQAEAEAVKEFDAAVGRIEEFFRKRAEQQKPRDDGRGKLPRRHLRSRRSGSSSPPSWSSRRTWKRRPTSMASWTGCGRSLSRPSPTTNVSRSGENDDSRETLLKLDQLRKLPHETEWVEFKEANVNYDFRKLGKYFSALSNEANLKNQPCGWLVFGVRNDRSICGTKFRENPSDLDSLKHEIARGDRRSDVP